MVNLPSVDKPTMKVPLSPSHAESTITPGGNAQINLEAIKGGRSIDFRSILESKLPDGGFARVEIKDIEDSIVLVFSKLVNRLALIKNISIEQSNKTTNQKDAYLQVARTMGILIDAITLTFNAQARFQEDKKREAEIRTQRCGNAFASADTVYIFNSGPIGDFENVQFFIRPEEFNGYYDPLERKCVGSREARTSISVVSRNLPEGTASIRIDKSIGKDSTNKLTFDVVVGSDDENQIDRLDLRGAGQVNQHHFKESHPLAIYPEQLHNGIVACIRALT